MDNPKIRSDPQQLEHKSVLYHAERSEASSAASHSLIRAASLCGDCHRVIGNLTPGCIARRSYQRKIRDIRNGQQCLEHLSSRADALRRGDPLLTLEEIAAAVR